MASDNPFQQCLALADSLEEALHGLGDTSAWLAYERLIGRCAEFRRQCRDLAEQKGLGELAIAFIGPKNAGKTTMLSLLVRSPEIISRLGAGVSMEAATEKITWISERPVRNLDLAVEQSWPVAATDLANLGMAYTLVDVPGSNELHRARAEAARRALRAAHIKVLVVEARTIEDAAILDYMMEADGACILPVINQIRPGVTQRDLDVFVATLRNSLPGATILTPIQVRDFELEEDATAAEQIGQQAGAELRRRLVEIIKDRKLDELLQPQLLGLKARFEKQMREELADELPATAAAARELRATESGLAVKALEGLLGAEEVDRVALVSLRQQLRGVYQHRTPVLFFPWRTLVSLANLLHGALEKLPLMLAGSVPSLLSSAMTAVKNVARDRDFRAARESGLQQRAELLVRERLQPQVAQLEAAIRSDLRGQQRQSSESQLDVTFDGLDLLQERSTRLFQDAIEKHAVTRAGVWITGLLGLAIFWAIFAWPMVALYKEYFAAIHHLLGGGGVAVPFPTHALPMLATSFLLALLPVLFFLLLVLSWAASGSRAGQCLAELRRAHHAAIEELGSRDLLRIRTVHPRLTSCLRLFGIGQ